MSFMHKLKRIARRLRWLFVILALGFLAWFIFTIFVDYQQQNSPQGIGNYILQVIGLIANIFGIRAGFSKDSAPEIKEHIDVIAQRSGEAQQARHEETKEQLADIKKLIAEGIPLFHTEEMLRERDEKIKKLTDELEKYQGPAQELRETALKALRDGRAEETEIFFRNEQQRLEQNLLEYAEATYQLGNAKFVALKFHDALESYKKATSLSPDNCIYLISLGRLQTDFGDLDGAINSLNHAVTISSKTLQSNSSIHAFSLLKLASAWREKGDLDKSINLANKSLEFFTTLYGFNSYYVSTALNDLGYSWKEKGNTQSNLLLQSILEH
jgi:tetratricopeptide (TPR) repeat protein